MSRHLPLAHLTSFAARLHLARHVGSRLEGGQLSLSDIKVIEAIASEADTLASLRSDDPGHYTLTRRFEVLLKHIEHKRAMHEISNNLAECLRQLCKELEESSCSDCVPKAERCLARSDNTFAQVQKKGTCIRPVKDMCNKIYEWIETLWRDTSDAITAPEIIFSTSHIQEFGSISNFIKTFCISGSALPINRRDLPAGEQRAQTRITIEVLSANFGWRQYCVLPYLFLHEILCHAFQSIDQRPVRERSEDDCPWSEGWMDRLAFLLAREWLDGPQAESFLISKRTQRDKALEQTIRLHDARYEVGRPGGVADGGPRHGRDVFDEALATYEAIDCRLPISQHPITNVSLRLNAETLSVTDRRDLLGAVQKQAATQPASLHRVFARYAAHGRIDTLRAGLGL